MAGWSINRCMFGGHVAKEPYVLGYSEKARCVVIQLAIERRYKHKDTDEPIVDFITMKAWSKTGKFILDHVHKGDWLSIYGEVNCDSYFSKRKQEHIYDTYVLIQHIDQWYRSKKNEEERLEAIYQAETLDDRLQEEAEIELPDNFGWGDQF